MPLTCLPSLADGERPAAGCLLLRGAPGGRGGPPLMHIRFAGKRAAAGLILRGAPGGLWCLSIRSKGKTVGSHPYRLHGRPCRRPARTAPACSTPTPSLPWGPPTRCSPLQVVFHGSTVAQWRKAGYQDQPEHAAFKQLLQVRLVCLVWLGAGGGRRLPSAAGLATSWDHDRRPPKAVPLLSHSAIAAPRRLWPPSQPAPTPLPPPPPMPALPPAGASGRGARHHLPPLPHAALHRLRPERQPGALPAGQAQPLGHLQHQQRHEQRNHHDRRRLAAGGVCGAGVWGGAAVLRGNGSRVEQVAVLGVKRQR